jgi:hypothetical protein
VRVTDAGGRPVAGVAVAFAVTAGGGAVAGSPATSGADGVARAASWTLGDGGAQALVATAADAPGASVTFAATVRAPAARYDIAFRLLTGATAAQLAALDRARARVEEVVTSELPDVASIPALEGCGSVAIAEPVDDLLILVDFRFIDGAGGTVGMAGPCMLRQGTRLPVLGSMRFDTADLASLEASGRLEAVLTHEMLHVLGVGTLWELLTPLTGAGTADPRFTGAGAVTAFREFNGGASFGWVPVEGSAAGAGTADSHWREGVFANELMTGFISGGSQPLSRTTVASLLDLGYEVDLTRADPFVIPGAALRIDGEGGLHLGDDVLRIPLVEIDSAGGARPLGP